MGVDLKMVDYKEIIEAIEHIKSLMLSYATDGRTEDHPSKYQEAYIDLDILLESAGIDNPNPYKTIEQFWKDCGGTWAERRELISCTYADIIFDLVKKTKSHTEPRQWKHANDVLNDELIPVRIQWLKAKQYIYSHPPDYENSIKESINSIESCLMILQRKPNATLGKLINDPRLDHDISKIIKHVYGLCSNKDFIRHGGVKSQSIGINEAEFFLEFASSSIIYIIKQIDLLSD